MTCPYLPGAFYKIFVFALFLTCMQSYAHAQLLNFENYEITTPIEGERCLICGVMLTEDDVVYLVKGRRVPLNKAMVDSFKKSPEVFFKKLQPRSVLFQEEFTAESGTVLTQLSFGWFLFGLYVLVGLVFGGLCAYRAVGKGLSAGKYFCFGFLFNIAGFLSLLVCSSKIKKQSIPKGLRKIPITHSSIVCNVCGNENHPCADSCAGCGVGLKPLVQSEVVRIK